MKKFQSILLASLLCVALVFSAGCLVEREKTDDETREEINQILDTVRFDADESYTGTLKLLYQDIPSERKINQALIDAFCKKYPNITVVKQPMVESNYLSLLPSMHSTAYRTKDYSEMPDVMWTTNEVFGGWILKDMLMPINFFDERDTGFSAADTVVPAMLQDSMLGDNLYMMPRDYDQIVMYYNKALLKKAGIDPDKEIPADRPLNHDEFDALMTKIRAHYSALDDSEINPENKRKYNEVRALDAQFAWGSLCWPTLKSFGGSVIAEDGSVNFDNEANLECMIYLRELIERELTFGAGSTKHANFVNQMTPLCFETRAVLTDMIDRDSKSAPGVKPEDLGVAPMPNLGKDANYAIGAGCSGYGMYRYAEHPTEAWLFIKFIIGEEGQNAFCQTGNGVPANQSLLFAEDASWRNLTGSEFSKLVDFNHDAYVHAYDTAACTLQDFKLRISVKDAREPISKQMTEVMEAALNAKKDTYKTVIADKLRRAQINMFNTIESYK